MLDRFTDLDESLAVGCHPTTPEDIALLARELGVEAVVNLQDDTDLAARGLDWGLLWQLYLAAGIEPTRVPIRDFDPKDLGRHLDEAVAAVAEHIAGGRKVYVHCNAGLNRSPSVLIAYLTAHRGLSLADATEWVRERHECIPYPDILAAWAKRRRLPLR